MTWLFIFWGAFSIYIFCTLAYQYGKAKPFTTRDFGWEEWALMVVMSIIFPIGILAINEVMIANEKDREF